MQQFSYAFAVGRIRALENRLLTPERLQRMLDASSAEDSYRLLVEAGYGSAGEHHGDFEAQIAVELQRVVDLMAEVSPDPALTDLFFLHFDLHNIKTLYKMRFSVDRVDIALSSLGTLPIEELTASMAERDYTMLSKAFRVAMQKADEEMSESVDPGRLDAWLDQAYYQTIVDIGEQHPDVFARDYFALSADFNNLLLAFRLKAMAQGVEVFNELFLPGGSLPINVVQKVFDTGIATADFAASRFAHALTSAFEEYERTHKLAVLERNRDNSLFKLVAQMDQGPVSIGPVLKYLLAREQEAKAIRLILTGKLNRVNDRLVKERVRELYA